MPRGAAGSATGPEPPELTEPDTTAATTLAEPADATTAQVDTQTPAGTSRPHPVLRVATWAVPGLVALAVGGWGLNALSIDRDETATIDIGTRTLPQMIHMLNRDDLVHGLYYLIMHYLMAIFGTSPTVVRLPSLAAAVAGASMLAVLGTRLVSYRAGFIAGLLYAGAPQISKYAHDARSYAIDALFVIVATYLLVRALGTRRRWIWVGYGAMVVVMVTLHVFTALVLVAQAVTVAWFAHRRRDWLPIRRWLVTMAGVAIALSPFALLSAEQSRLLGWISPPTMVTVQQFFVQASGGKWLIVPMFGLALFAWRRPGTGRADTPSVFQIAWPWLLLPPALLLAVSVTYEPRYVFRYVLYVLPALFLLVGAALDKLRWHLAVPAALVLLVAMIPMQLNVRDPATAANNTRAEAALLAREKQPGDAILFLIPSQRYFANSYPPAYRGLRDILLYRSQAETGTFSGWSVTDKTLEKRLLTVDRVWAVKYWDWPKNRPADNRLADKRYAEMEAAGLRWVHTTHFRGGAILLFARPGH